MRTINFNLKRCALVAAALMLPGLSQAVLFQSADLPSYTGTGSVPASGTTVLLTNFPSVWVPENDLSQGDYGSSEWISYADTGTGGPTDGSTMTISLTLADLGTGARLAFNVWADDTAMVVLDGATLIDFNGLTDGICAGPDPIGCQPAEYFSYSAILAAGIHTLDFITRQDNGDGFGINYKGYYTAVPIPGALFLFGLGIVSVICFGRRRSTAA